jgi:hypothetical protein
MKTMHFVWSAFACFIAAGCGAADGVITSDPNGTNSPHQGGASEQTSKLRASEKTKAETGISTWEISVNDDSYRGIGRDAYGRSLVDFRASNAAACTKNGTLVPADSNDGQQPVYLRCSTDTAGRPVDAKTRLMWDRLSSDTGPAQAEHQSQLSAPSEALNCPTQTNTMCCGHVTLWCEDQWTNQNFECETSSWYICGTCFSWSPACN